MNTEEKYNVAMDIIQRAGFQDDKEVIFSIASCIKHNRFFIEYDQGNIAIFLTWEDNLIDNKRYIFVNNLWIEPNYRSIKTLIRVRNVLRYILGKVHKFYWFNREKQKMIYRS